MLADLHIHTVNSDGFTSEQEIKSSLSKNHLPAILGIVDHHVLTNRKTIQRGAVTIIAGVEISSEIGSLGNHILGYSSEFKNTELLRDTFSIINDGYNERAIKIIDGLRRSDILVDSFESLVDKSKSGVVYINQIANSVRCLNNFQSVAEVKKFAKNNGNLFFVEEKQYLPSSKDTVDLLHSCGAIAIWGHPGKRFNFASPNAPQELEKYLHIMIEYGLDGVEVFHPSHSKKQVDFLLNFALKNELLITGGSDYHGIDRDAVLGEVSLEDCYLEKFLFRLENL